MVEIRYFWIDGSYDSFIVERAQAERMQEKLYKNPDIVSVEIIE